MTLALSRRLRCSSKKASEQAYQESAAHSGALGISYADTNSAPAAATLKLAAAASSYSKALFRSKRKCGADKLTCCWRGILPYLRDSELAL